MREDAAAAESDEEHEELYDDEAGEEGVGHRRIFREKLRSRLEALDDEAAHEDGGDGFTRDAESQRRDERAAGDGVVRCFGACDAFDGAVSKFLRCLGELLGGIVAEEAGDGGARARKDADDVPDEPGADDGRRDLFQFMGFEQYGVFEFHDAAALFDGFFHEDEDLGHGEEADHRAGDVDAVVEFVDAEHIALRSFHRIHADGGEDEAEGAAHEALDHGAGGDAGDDGESEEGEPEIFRTAEFHRKLCKERCEEVEGNAGEKPAEERSGAGGAERFARASLLGELIAIECGRS